MCSVRFVRVGLCLVLALVVCWQFGLFSGGGRPAQDFPVPAAGPGADFVAACPLPGPASRSPTIPVTDVGPLVEALRDPCAAVRGSAAEALGWIDRDSPAAVAALVPLLRDPEAAVRLEAARSLGRLGRPARPAITHLMTVQHDADPAVRRAATAALLTHILVGTSWTGGLGLLPLNTVED